jgi:hypothetical protein
MSSKEHSSVSALMVGMRSGLPQAQDDHGLCFADGGPSIHPFGDPLGLMLDK